MSSESTSENMIMSLPVYTEDCHCGYCDKDNSFMLGLLCDEMLCSDYKTVMDLGFRRSGEYFYKPDTKRSCCKLYTIRLDADNFKISGEQRKCLKKFHKFLGLQTPAPEKNKPFDFDRSMAILNESADLSVELSGSEFSEEKFELYKRYQVAVHGDEPDRVTEKQFISFLCDSPLKRSGTDDEFSGSKHQLYYYRGKLVAFGVLDILPGALSSVYFVRDPELDHLMLGKVGALYEIALTRSLGSSWGYYLGFYVDNCQKMKYKGAYKPSYLLDPETSYQEAGKEGAWRPFEEFQREFSKKSEAPDGHVNLFVTFKQAQSSDYDEEKWRQLINLLDEITVNTLQLGTSLFGEGTHDVSMNDIVAINGRLCNEELLELLTTHVLVLLRAMFSYRGINVTKEACLNAMALCGIIGPEMMSRIYFIG